MSELPNYNPGEEINDNAYSVKRGDEVRIPRNDGAVESWIVQGTAPDGKVTVTNRRYENVKIIDLEIIEKYNGPLREGSIVKILRSNKLVDDGWEIRRFLGDGEDQTVEITKVLPDAEGKPALHKKIVTLRSIQGLN